MGLVSTSTINARTNNRSSTKLCNNYKVFIVLVQVVFVLSHVSAVSASQNNHRHQVLRLFFQSDDDLPLIRKIQAKHNLDPWQEVRGANSSGDYLVSPQHVLDLKQQLVINRIPYQVLIDDAERFVEDNDPLRSRKREKRSTDMSAHDFRHKFLSYIELRQFLRHVNITATNAKVQVDSIGRSFEGRPTPYVKISSLSDNSSKGTIFIDGGIHGREWISPALTVEIIHRLAFNTENDTAVNKLLTMFDWIIVPLVNPDGYTYTFTPGLAKRLWRKSRANSYSNDHNCFGVDINRNFGYQWNNSPKHGGSSNPCSPTFSGPQSFSEPESRNLRSLLLKYSDSIQAYLSFHSFGQFFLYPWGYSKDVDIEDEDDLQQVASAFSKTMMKKNYEYSVGGSAKVLYPAAGGSDDYVHGIVGVKFAYTVELPPHETSSYGFMLPEYFVRSVVSDTWDGLKAFILKLHKHLQSHDETKTNIQGDSPHISSGTDTSIPAPKSAYKPETEAKLLYRKNHSRQPAHITDKMKRLRQVSLSQVVQSLLTPGPIWISQPRIPSAFLRETNNRDIGNTFLGKN